jgi:hypothetical protein
VVRKLGLDPAELGMNEKPSVLRPTIKGKPIVPRLRMSWGTRTRLGANFEIETEKGVVKALYVGDDGSYYGTEQNPSLGTPPHP